MAENEYLLDVYKKGFSDELKGVFDGAWHQMDNIRIIRAYNLGISHALIGDDVRLVDYLSDEEILKMIRNGKI